MNRLIRIAFTLFATATVLAFLVQRRLHELKDRGPDLAEELVRHENQMALLGIILAGLMVSGGFVLIVVAIARGRKKTRNDHG